MVQNHNVFRGIQFLLTRKVVKRNYSTEATLPTSPYKVFKLTDCPSQTSHMKKDEAIRLYYQMCCIRRMESSFAQMYTKKLIRGFCHLYDGQEAIAVGMRSAMDHKKDTFITAYRAHGWAFVMGISLNAIFSELLGRKGGCAKGKGGSMHTYGDKFYGGNGIVGAHVPLGTGIGFQHKYNNTGGISVIAYGDGASNQGQIAESFNMAKLWNLPCLYVCENNLYGMGTSTKRASANTEYYTRGDVIPGILADGMDICATREATKYCRDWISSGKGPIILEVLTYRYHGHSMSDPGTSYRTRDEIKNVRDRTDPISMFKSKLVKATLCTEEELNSEDKKAKKLIEEIAQKSMKDSEIPLAELYYDIYSNNLEGKIRATLYDKPGEHKVTGPAVNFE